MTGSDHLFGERAGVRAEQGEQGLEAPAIADALAIRADVRQEEIAERESAHALGPRGARANRRL
jgi:hypothetical protein